MKKDKVYIFGPIFLFGESYLPVYEKLNKLCEKYFDEVIGTYPDFWNSEESARDFYDRTYKTIKDCDLFIAECSSPSHGVGMELQMGMDNNIPVIVLAREDIDNFEKSIMVLGLPNLVKVIRYKNIDDLLIKLDLELSRNWKI